ncbi:alpha/beta hydrolase fold-domain-containing protein [Hygrophoropsis aurantiaca]|uniref:Alpha/beta hydrolase fold-domain-containing protein n=1 Tax=Hygrophoropsis aurantiaca TaxID=72124 RepID=A0ACB8AVL6_9AGAM|nr:alpha/beta hydrolase fold-domain-containing protein [Hygrophoropsis aurantiaca]
MAQSVPNPIDPDILPRLDPEYVAFHNKYVAHIVPYHTVYWDPSMRAAMGNPVPGSSEVVKVGSVKDYDLSHCRVRVFTPEGTTPVDGWPVYIWFHGGGWTVGGIDTQNHLVSRQCKGAKCVALTVDYRLAPEHPYPAAVEDALEALQWVYEKGSSNLGINPQRIAIGGESAGGNLSAILSIKAAQLTPPIPLLSAQLVAPVTDNTADPSGDRYPSWKEVANTPFLTVGRMLWFKDKYLPKDEDCTKWDISPIFAPTTLLAKSPKTWIAVMELDILRDEGLAYAEKLKKAGVDVSTKTYMRVPHPILAMDVL